MALSFGNIAACSQNNVSLLRRLPEILLEVFLKEFYRLFHRRITLSAGGILMTAAVEKKIRKFVHRTIALAPERYLYLVLVLPHKHGIVNILYLQGKIDKTFRIARLKIEAVEFPACQGDQRRMLFGIDFHFPVQTVSHQAHPAFGIGVEHLVVDGILVHAQLHQLIDNRIVVGLVGVEREIAGICHHSRVDTFCRGQVHQAEIPAPADETEHKFTGGRNVRIGYGYISNFFAPDAATCSPTDPMRFKSLKSRHIIKSASLNIVSHSSFFSS